VTKLTGLIDAMSENSCSEVITKSNLYMISVCVFESKFNWNSWEKSYGTYEVCTQFETNFIL